MDYTSVGAVATALAFQAPETLALSANASAGSVVGVDAGATSLTLNQNPPDDWQVGRLLLLDMNNTTIRETVTITGLPDGNVVPITSAQYSHDIGTPVVDGTILDVYVSQTSRWFDSVTYTPSGFGYESVTETRDGYFNISRGTIMVPLSKPLVALSDITSVTYQSDVFSQADSLDLTKAWVKDNYFLEIAAPSNYGSRQGLITVSYSSGYQTIPDDITLACTMMAARFYKERDSGYSDVVGTAETGILQYKKAMPADVAAIVERYRRWTV